MVYREIQDSLHFYFILDFILSFDVIPDMEKIQVEAKQSKTLSHACDM